MADALLFTHRAKTSSILRSAGSELKSSLLCGGPKLLQRSSCLDRKICSYSELQQNPSERVRGLQPSASVTPRTFSDGFCWSSSHIFRPKGSMIVACYGSALSIFRFWSEAVDSHSFDFESAPRVRSLEQFEGHRIRERPQGKAIPGVFVATVCGYCLATVCGCCLWLLLFVGYCLWLLFVATVCGYCLWLLFVATVCGYCLWLLFVATVCSNCLWLLFVATAVWWLLFVATACGYCLWLLFVTHLAFRGSAHRKT